MVVAHNRAAGPVAYGGLAVGAAKSAFSATRRPLGLLQ